MIVVGRKASAGAATVDEGRLTAFPLMGGLEAGLSDVVGEDTSEAVPLSSAGRGGLTRLGFVMGIADFVTVREAIALVRARWCGERAERIISHFNNCCCQWGEMTCPAGDPCARRCC